MDCPACVGNLTEIKVGDVLVDVCQKGCGGIWFDRNEIKKLDEVNDPGAESLLKLDKQEEINLKPFPRRCPKCEREHLVRSSYDRNNPVEIDMCWRCGGIWLDIGELEDIRCHGGNREEAGNAFLKQSIDLHTLCLDAGTKTGEFGVLNKEPREVAIKIFERLKALFFGA